MRKIIILFFICVSYNSNAQFTTSGGKLITNKKVGIGLTNPTARLDIKLKNNFISTDESGLRITYPNVEVPIGYLDVNESVFQIRKKSTFGTFENYFTNFIVKRTGKVGIGTNNPQSRLDIRLPNKQEIIIQSEVPNTYGGFLFNHSDGTANWRIRAYSNFTGGYNNILGIQSAGGQGDLWIVAKKTLIGNYFNFDSCTDCDEYKLFVKKGIRTEKIKVDMASGVWADYVFNNEYKLNSLEYVEKFIIKNGHLPNMPSALQVEKEGLDLGNIAKIQQEKIEELTLYVIQLKKELDGLRKLVKNVTNQQ